MTYLAYDFSEFCTINVVDMDYMFNGAKLPANLCIGDILDTSNVESMQSMFAESSLEKSAIGNLDTRAVKNMSCMFRDVTFKGANTLGNQFDTSKVKRMIRMFQDTKLPSGFSLGDKFNTSCVNNMTAMFENCRMPASFTLGDKFDTSNVTSMLCMFRVSVFSNDFFLGDKFNTRAVKDMNSMFEECKMNETFTVTDSFVITKYQLPFLHAMVPKRVTSQFRNLNDTADSHRVLELLKA